LFLAARHIGNWLSSCSAVVHLVARENRQLALRCETRALWLRVSSTLSSQYHAALHAAQVKTHLTLRISGKIRLIRLGTAVASAGDIIDESTQIRSCHCGLHTGKQLSWLN